MPNQQKRANLMAHIERLNEICMTYEIRKSKGTASTDDIRDLKHTLQSLKVAKSALARL